MQKRNVYIPNELISELFELKKSESYKALDDVFSGVNSEKDEYLSLNIEGAKNLICMIDIELSKAILKYPFNEEDNPRYDPEHEEKFDDVMMGVYEKTYYYLQSEFHELKNS